MKKIVFILIVILWTSGAFGQNPISGSAIGAPSYPGVKSDGSDGLVMGNADAAIPATGTLTIDMHNNYILNDSALSGTTNVQLLAISAECSFRIRISVGTHGISLLPPATETLIMISTALDAGDEIDLSHVVFDEFLIERMAYGAGYVYRVTPVIGSVADGGAS